MASSMSKRSKPNNKKHQHDTLSSKPPPLTIEYIGSQSADYGGVSKILSKVKNFDNDFQLKMTSDGVKVRAATTDIYKKLLFHLQTSATDIQFFHHSLREDQTSKFVLHGLYDMPETELMTHLKATGVEPSKVRKMTIKEKKFKDHTVFLVYFPKTKKMKISRLREIKAINYVRVNWDFFSHKRKSPIQCSNCMKFGHGGNGCHLKPMCIRCGMAHKSIECPLLIDPSTNQERSRIPDKDLHCGLCGQNHAANYSQCEKRKAFVERQTRFRSKTQRVRNPQRSFVPAPQLNDFHFPRLNAPQNVQRPASRREQQNIVNDRFSAAELTKIFNEMMVKMQATSTKMQAIQVLGEIVIKYCYNEN